MLWKRTIVLLSPSAKGSWWCYKLHSSFPFPPLHPFFFGLSKSWPSYVIPHSLILNRSCCLLLFSMLMWKKWRWGGTPCSICFQEPPLAFPWKQGRGNFGGAGASGSSHLKSFPDVYNCFGTHWQFGRLTILPRVNFLRLENRVLFIFLCPDSSPCK